MTSSIKKYWFIIGLFFTAMITLADPTDSAVITGRWLKQHWGPDIIIAAIFYLSGLILELTEVRRGLKDMTGTLVALGAIFFAAPLVAASFSCLPLDKGILIGLFLIASMPTTLSSGVVMTGAAGGNMAHALLITVVSNCIAVVTIPFTLAALLFFTGDGAVFHIDVWSIMRKIAFFVILPLGLGMLFRFRFEWQAVMNRARPKIQDANQFLILIMVWMALAQTRESIMSGYTPLVIVGITVIYHAIMLGLIGAAIYLLKIGRGRRESVLFMGAQKTLTLSILLQSFLFPQYGTALACCVIHHIVHLSMDGYWVQKLRPGDTSGPAV